MNNTLVFGKNGFIAKSLRKNIKEKKINNFKFFSKSEVNLLDKKELYKIKYHTKVNKNIIFISALAPVKDIKSLIDNIQMIYNFLNSIDIKKINHLIYISSDAVYSDSKNVITEKSDTSPTSLHGMMHLIREEILKKNIDKNKLCILRPTLIYGKGDTHLGYGPNLFRNNLINKETIKLFGNGAERRDHIHINDVIDSIIKINKKKYYGTYNLTSGYVISFKEIAKLLSKNFNSHKRISSIKRNQPMPHFGLRILSNKKISTKLNKKFMNFIEGIKYL